METLDKNQITKWLICLALAVIVLLIPCGENFTIQLKLYFAITVFVIAVMALSLLPILVSALLLPLLYMMSGLANSAVAFSPWTALTVWMILGVLILSEIMFECGLMERIAYGCILKCGGSFTGIIVGLSIAGFFLCVCTLGNVHFVLLALGYGLCKSLDLKPGRFPMAIFAAIFMFGASPAMYMYAPQYLEVAVTNVQNVIPGFTASWTSQFQYLWPMFFAFVVTMIIYVKFFMPKDRENLAKDIDGKTFFQKKYQELGPMKAAEKKCLVIVLLLLVYVFSSPLHGQPVAYGFILAPLLMYAPGIQVGTPEALNRVNWGMIAFIATCIGIGAVGGAVGLGPMLSAVVSPHLEGVNPAIALTAMTIIGTIANLALTPVSMVASLATPFVTIGMDLGISNPMLPVMSLLVATDILFLPHEAAMFLLAYGYGYFSMKDFVVYETMKSVVMILFFCCIILPYWSFMGWM